MLEFNQVTKVYDGTEKAVNNLTLDIEKGEFIVFIGPSGCGKTTTMKMVNRLIETTEGSISIEGENIKNKDLVELRRTIGYVIQQIGLFPHMTIQENISLVPKLLKWPQDKRRDRAKELLKLVEMEESYLDKFPEELSGGQQQRIGVLRALAADPPLILMDEPFGALDPITRETLQMEFKQLQKSLHKTIVFVTHDMDEALKLADRVVIMKEGCVVQEGTPSHIVRNPANDFVREFIGKDRLVQNDPSNQTVEEIMNPNPVTVQEDMNLREAIKIVKANRVDTAVVVNEEKELKGFIDVDTINRYHRDNLEVGKVLKEFPIEVKKGTPLAAVIRKILVSEVKYMPVIDENKSLIGIITGASLADVVYESIWGEEEHQNGENETIGVK
ncbi:ABC transporter ATP-binding protein [Thalassobacillus sp. CUG 92003]|uniref:ABC transporter ATP-binding protein n=1 Tax=Thalassobacillus sp. CUG 92003 TaxID=2736641 RepID=UPI0015E744FC|nr:betaine/proline/choline family ABC transporter ATP-binding protein [Thalassobacillus sp. CUG 92003]